MSVRSSQFGRAMDKGGKSLQNTFKRAAAAADVNRKPDKFAKPSVGDRVLLGMLRAKKKVLGSTKPKSVTTARTQKITGQLKQAGLTQSEIDRLRGKKK